LDSLYTTLWAIRSASWCISEQLCGDVLIVQHHGAHIENNSCLAFVVQETDTGLTMQAASSCVIRLSVINLRPLMSHLIEMPPLSFHDQGILDFLKGFVRGKSQDCSGFF
jgi:hypothetical protein